MKDQLVLLWRSLGLGAALFAWIGSANSQTAPEFTRIQRLTNKEVSLRLTGPTGSNYRIDASTNLPAFESLVTLPRNTGFLQHTDSAAAYLNSRFYRALQLSGTNLTGDHLATTNGDVIIHPLYHASFVMTWNGKTIYADPDSTASYAGLPRADLILITHHHGDHLDVPTLNSLRTTNTMIIAPQRVYDDSTMTAALRSLTTVLTNGVTTNVMGLTVQAVPAYNLTTSNHPRGRDNGYVLTIGGKHIYIAGDTEDIPEMRALREIDVAFIPMNRPFTMYVTNAVSAVREFRPSVVYPYHYIPSTPPADVNQFKQQVGTDLAIEVRLRRWY